MTDLPPQTGTETGCEPTPCSIKDALTDLAQGHMLVLVDDDKPDSYGALVLCAEHVTPDKLSMLMREVRGPISLAMTGARADALSLPVLNDASRGGRAYTPSINAAEGMKSGGISASDRCATILAAISPDATPRDLVSPGHVSPVRAREGGVLVRAGIPEASVDLARLARCRPIAMFCEILNEEGELADLAGARAFAQRHNLRVCSIEKLIEHRMQSERIIERVAFTRMPTRWGYFDAAVYRSQADGKEHVALCHNVKPRDLWQPGDHDYSAEPVLVRVHSECLTGDALGSLRCDCGEQLATALQHIMKAERGALLYMRQEGRGIGLANKLRAYELQDQGYDTVEANHMLGMKADQREYGTGAQMLRDLGISRLLLISNNPRKFTALGGYGLEIADRVAIELKPNIENKKYLRDKRDKMGHLLTLPEDSQRLPKVSP